MEEKKQKRIAVDAPTKELWEQVRQKRQKDKKAYKGSGAYFVSGAVFYLDRGTWGEVGTVPSDVTIITAQEYLGGKDVKEFEVGDRVEGMLKDLKGEGGIICDIRDHGGSIGIRWDNKIGLHDCHGFCKEGHGRYMAPEKIKLITKPKTTKENNMNISENILEVFTSSKDAKKVANRFGDQYGNSERDLLALKRDATDLLAIIKDEEDEAKKAVKK